MNVIFKRTSRQDGAAAVEFAIISGVLVMLIFGMLEFGLAFWQVQNLRAATREGARVAAVRGTEPQIKQRMIDASSGSFTAAGSISVAPGFCNADRSGEAVTVTVVNGSLPASVQGAFQIDIPFIPTVTIEPVLSGTFRCE